MSHQQQGIERWVRPFPCVQQGQRAGHQFAFHGRVGGGIGCLQPVLELQPRAVLTWARVAGGNGNRAELNGFAEMGGCLLGGDSRRIREINALAHTATTIRECAHQKYGNKHNDQRRQAQQDFLQHFSPPSRIHVTCVKRCRPGVNHPDVKK